MKHLTAGGRRLKGRLPVFLKSNQLEKKIPHPSSTLFPAAFLVPGVQIKLYLYRKYVMPVVIGIDHGYYDIKMPRIL